MARLYTTSPNGASTCSMIVKTSEIYNEFDNGWTYGVWSVLSNKLVVIAIHYLKAFEYYTLPIGCHIRSAVCSREGGWTSESSLRKACAGYAVNITWDGTFNDRIMFGSNFDPSDNIKDVSCFILGVIP